MTKFIPAIFIILIIIVFANYTDFSLYSVPALISGLSFYCLMSVITGIRININAQNCLPITTIFTIPAAMGFAGYIFPFKGGGIWLVAHLKSAHGLSYLSSFSLALQNTTISISLLILLILNTYYTLTISYQLIFLFSAIVLVNSGIAMMRKIKPKIIAIDTLLSLLYVIFLSLIPYMFIEVSVSDAIVFSAIIMSSSLIKVTPGNIGILEGFAAMVSSFTSNSLFLELAIFFRLLSLIHATVFGLPSFYWLAKKHYWKSKSAR